MRTIDIAQDVTAPMAKSRSRRKLTLLDLMILVAGVAVGAAWLRFTQPSFEIHMDTNFGIFDFFYRKIIRPCNYIFPIVAGLMTATMTIRFLPPKPSGRLLIRQTGWTACLAASIVFALQWSFLGLLTIYLKFFLSSRFGQRDIRAILYNYRLDINFFDPGTLIWTVWITQIVLRRHAPVADWVDQLGRLLGWCCLFMGSNQVLFNKLFILQMYGLLNL